MNCSSLYVLNTSPLSDVPIHGLWLFSASLWLTCSFHGVFWWAAVLHFDEVHFFLLWLLLLVFSLRNICLSQGFEEMLFIFSKSLTVTAFRAFILFYTSADGLSWWIFHRLLKKMSFIHWVNVSYTSVVQIFCGLNLLSLPICFLNYWETGVVICGCVTNHPKLKSSNNL